MNMLLERTEMSPMTTDWDQELQALVETDHFERWEREIGATVLADSVRITAEESVRITAEDEGMLVVAVNRDF